MILPHTQPLADPLPPPGQRSVDDVVAAYSDKVSSRLLPRFQFAGVAWPPERVVLVATKDTRRLELWVLEGAEWVRVREYRIKGMSGGFGPKLREGDRQVPEGFYNVTHLNPNSRFHLSMKLDYPNLFDRAQAERDGRSDLGGDIFIHGGVLSTGCLAVGDNAIEELFVLAAEIGSERISVLISPKDFRYRPLEPLSPETPPWVFELHQQIAANLERFPLGGR
ncbi:MAG: hypothetical protein B0D96_07750 [Candidatus Sedimenticola endophacoides]|nr:MAG: hypothetical protein B0D94_12405 [Candidatus Sedimenticola endophacoides]OQX35069.1 MAG: hypothetical protein B0D96_07750 [Candidatus Sedimenticola endophacoides]OQX40410.1 MAG: hypothetical protein B0D89_07920 [Candidatus Sedimenticola endophacoides]OQX43116.1 MAG: hypothetical protein B0D88_05175 [Candidatus Sedimenticola endophacoides]